MLKPQSIRGEVKVYINHSPKPAKKDEIIALSEGWTENQTNLFKRFLKQGGYVEIKGVKYRLVV